MIEISLVTIRLMVVKLETMRLQRRKIIKKTSKSKKIVGPSDFSTSGARLAFTKLRQVFVKALILHYFDLERHIQSKTDVLGYAISEILNQLTLNNLG